MFIPVTVSFLFIPVIVFFLLIPVKDKFVYTSQSIVVFIYHTSAPVEVSVWRGGRSLWSDFYAVYDSVVWRGVRGLWELHAWAAAVDLGVEGLLAQATWLPPLCIHQVVDCVAGEGK